MEERPRFFTTPTGMRATVFDESDRVVPRQQPVKVSGSKMQLDLPRLAVTTVVLPIH